MLSLWATQPLPPDMLPLPLSVVNIVIPTPHRKRQMPQTPVSLSAFARSAFQKPHARDLIYTPIPVSRVLSAWLAVAVVVRVNEAVREALLVPAFGTVGGQIISAILSIAGVLAVTCPFFRNYAGQWTSTIAWYGIVLATLTVLLDLFFAVYVQRLYGFEIREQYNVLHGQLWPLVVVVIGFTPYIWSRWADR